MKWLIGALALGGLGYLGRPVLPPLVVAAVLAYILSPIVDALQRRAHISRLAAVFVLYALLLGGLGLGIWVIESRLIHEVRALSEAGPDLVDAAFVRLLGSESFQFLGQRADAHSLAIWTNQRLGEIAGAPTDALRIAERALDTALKTVLALVALFYLMLDGHRLLPYLLRFVPTGRREEVVRVAGDIHRVLARYLRGQLFLVGLMSTVTFLVLAFVFQLPFALPIALLTGLLEVVPFLGPVLAGTIAATVALVHGGIWTMVGVIAAYFVLRQAEDQLVMPVVIGRAVELHPLVAIAAVLTGAAAAGVLGALLAVPIAAALRVLIDHLYPPVDDDAGASGKAVV